MEIEQIRKALEWELGEGIGVDVTTTRLSGTMEIVITMGDVIPVGNLLLAPELTDKHRAAIGRALQSAAGEGPLIPLADAVRVVEEFFWPDDRTGQRAIAALQALGGGDDAK